MARPRADDYDNQRDVILQHAIDAFAQLGYASASMQDLALRCGLSKATLYHYFPTKEAILFAALARHTDGLVALASEVIAPLNLANQTPAPELAAQTLRLLLRAFMSRYKASKSVHLVLLNGPQFLGPDQQRIIRVQERKVVEIFGSVLSQCFPDVLNNKNRFALSMTLLSSLNFSFAWLHDDGPLSHEQYADWIADLWLKGVRHSEFVYPAATQH